MDIRIPLGTAALALLLLPLGWQLYTSTTFTPPRLGGTVAPSQPVAGPDSEAEPLDRPVSVPDRRGGAGAADNR